MKLFNLKSFIAYLYVSLTLLIFSSTKPAIAQSQNPSQLSCKVHTFLVNQGYQLPYRYDTTEVAHGSSLNEGNYIVYLFEVQTNTSDPKTITRATVSQLMQANEPIEIVAVRGQEGYPMGIDGQNKTITSELNYAFTQSAHYPTEYLFKITDNPLNYPKTSSLFTVETSVGTAECASLHRIKSETTTNPVDWNTPYASLKSTDLYIKIGSQKFFGKEPMTIHSDPGIEKTTLEVSWSENGVEMGFFLYFKKTENNMWEMYESRTYNGQPHGDWLYYWDSDNNPVSSLIGQANYRAGRRFVSSNTQAEINCQHCSINAFMPKLLPISPLGYSLEALIGLAQGEIITLSTQPNTGYGVNVLLRNSPGEVIKDQFGLTYNWRVQNPQIVSLMADILDYDNGTCAYGINLPCPLNHADLSGLSAGETTILVEVRRNENNTVVAQTSFPVKVVEEDKIAQEVKEQKLKELEQQVEKLTKNVEQQQTLIEKLRRFLRRIFGRLFNFD